MVVPTSTRTASAVARAIISMAQNLNLKIIAEGIEQPEQLFQLATMNCQYGQGYYISKPIDEHRLWDVLQTKVYMGRWQL